jgi:hypothetical protein
LIFLLGEGDERETTDLDGQDEREKKREEEAEQILALIAPQTRIWIT